MIINGYKINFLVLDSPFILGCTGCAAFTRLAEGFSLELTILCFIYFIVL